MADYVDWTGRGRVSLSGSIENPSSVQTQIFAFNSDNLYRTTHLRLNIETIFHGISTIGYGVTRTRNHFIRAHGVFEELEETVAFGGVPSYPETVLFGYIYVAGSTTDKKVSTTIPLPIDRMEKGYTYYLTLFPGRASFMDGTQSYTILTSVKLRQTLDTVLTQCTTPYLLRLTGSPTVFDGGYCIPSSELTLSWIPSQPGNGVAITGYDVYITNQDGYYEYQKTVTTTSCQVSTSNIRGQEICFKVKAIASIEGYDSELSDPTLPIYINKLPNPPDSKEIKIKSYETSVTFNPVPGTDSDAQDCEIWYSSSRSGEIKNPIPIGGIQVSPVTAPYTTILYTWTFDGLEYSEEPVLNSLQKNTKPKINSFSANCPSHLALGLIPNKISGSYCNGWCHSPKNIFFTSNKLSGQAELTLQLESVNGPEEEDFTEPFNIEKTVLLAESNFTSGQVQSTLNYNLYNYMPNWPAPFSNFDSSIKWRLKLIIYDGMEYSDPVCFPAEDSNKYYAIARAPRLSDSNVYFYNQDGNDYIPNTSHSSGTETIYHYGNIVKAVIPKDSSLANSRITSITGLTTNKSYTVTSDLTGNFCIYTFNLANPEKDMANSDKDFTITISCSTGDNGIGPTKSISAILHETPFPVLENFVSGQKVFKPFTGTAQPEVHCDTPFGTYSLEEGLTNYNCSQDSAISLELINSAGTLNIIPTEEWDVEADTLGTTFNENEIFDIENKPAGWIYRGSKNCNLKMHIKNLFNQDFVSNSDAISLNFTEPVQNLQLNSNKFKSGDNYITFSSSSLLQGGLDLEIGFGFKYYSDGDYRVTLMQKNGSQDWARCAESVYSLTNASASGNILSNALQFTLPSNLDGNMQYQFGVSLVNTDANSSSSNYSFNAIRRMQPNLSINTYSTSKDEDGNGYVSIDFSAQDTGIDSNSTLTFFVANPSNTAVTSEYSITPTGSNYSKDFYYLSSFSNWEAETVHLATRMTPTASAAANLIGPTDSVVFYDDETKIIYNVKPLVAYRKNSVGINTDTIDSNAAVEIHAANGRNLVVFKDPATSHSLKIDFVNGIITYV